MVDQAQITPANGRTELPPRAVARGTADFLHDAMTLAELQGKLVLVDFREGTAKVLVSALALLIGVSWALGCFPIALVALAVALKESTTLSLSASFGIALLVGIGLSGLLAIPAIFALKAETHMFDRSFAEWRRNLQWIKDTLKRLGQTTTARNWPHSTTSPRW